MKRRKTRRVRRNRGLKRNAPRLNMYTKGEKYIGTFEIPKPNGDYDVWEIVRRGRVFVIGTATNTGLLSDYYFKMEQGESEQKALEEINADLEVLATDGPSYMSRVKKIPSRKIEVSRQRAERRRNLQGNRRRVLRRNASTNKYEMRFDSRSTGIFVWMTDKFMSGWGQARGKINKLIIRCDTLEQAECIFKNAQMRDEMKNINYGRKLPYFSESKYKLSFKTWDQLGYVWKTGCAWQNEDDYYSDPGRMIHTRY